MTREQQLEAENKRLKEQRIKELEAENAKLKHQNAAKNQQSGGMGFVETAAAVGVGVIGADLVLDLFD